MGAHALLAELAGAGLSVTAEGDRLVIRPASTLSDDQRTALRAAKLEILAFLAKNPAGHDPRPADVHARHLARRDRLRRWGWPDREADALTERLARRDAAGDDDRVSCADCRHAQIRRCGNHSTAGLTRNEIGQDWVSTLQRCPGFIDVAPD